MPYIIIGIVVGAAAALSPAPWITGPIDAATNALIAAGQHVTMWLAGLAGQHSSTFGQTVAIVLGAAVPGLVCLALVAAARAGLMLRRVIAAVLVGGGIAGFFFLPFGEAMALAVAAVLVAILFSLTSGLLVVAPLAGMAAAVAVTCGKQLWSGPNTTLSKGAVTLSHLTHFDYPTAWKLVLLVVAWSGFVGAGYLALRGRDRSGGGE